MTKIFHQDTVINNQFKGLITLVLYVNVCDSLIIKVPVYIMCVHLERKWTHDNPNRPMRCQVRVWTSSNQTWSTFRTILNIPPQIINLNNLMFCRFWTCLTWSSWARLPRSAFHPTKEKTTRCYSWLSCRERRNPCGAKRRTGWKERASSIDKTNCWHCILQKIVPKIVA